MNKLTYNDFYNDMGLVDQLMMNPISGAIWPTKAYIEMGNYMHGGGLSPDWIAAIPGGVGNAYYNDLTNTPWQDIIGWVNIQPAADNTCTNAAIKIWDFQLQWFDLTDNKWKLANNDAYNYRSPTSLNYYITNTFASDGSADNIFLNRDNIIRGCCTKSLADRAALSSDTSKFRILRSMMSRASLNWSKIGGITVMFKAKIEPISGSLNGKPSVYAMGGANYTPRTGINAGQVGTILENITNLPIVGSGKLKKLTTQEQTFLFTTADINPNTYKVINSVYALSYPVNTYPQCMNSATFTNHIPQFINFKPVRFNTLNNHVLIPPISGLAHEINGVLGSSEAQLVLRQSFIDGGALLPPLAKASQTDTGFPIVESVTQTVISTDSLSHPANMPVVVNPGDGLLVYITTDGAPTITTPTGWKRLYSDANGTSVKGACYLRVATGVEAGTTVDFVTLTIERAAIQVFRISNWNGTLAGVHVGTSAQITTGGTADLPAITTYWGLAKTLFIVSCHTSTAQNVLSAPTNYTDLTQTVTGTSTSDAQCITARRNLLSASEDPDVFTLSGTGASRVYNTIAIAPANAGMKYEHFNITRDGNTLWLGLYTSQPISVSDSQITRAIVVCHGSSLAPDDYSNVVLKNMGDYLGNTIIIAPFFAEATSILETGQIYWDSQIWPELGNSTSSLAFNISSGEVLDEIINSLYTTFVNLEGVVIAGHSAGAQLCNRYSAASSDNRNRYLVSAASSYLYLDNKRQDGAGGWNIPLSPSSYNNYKYGLNNLASNASSYVQNIGTYELINRLLSAKVTYMVGALDNDPGDTSMDTSGSAVVQGANRLDRQKYYHAHLQNFYSHLAQ